MLIEFTVVGQAAPEVRKVFSTPRGPRGVRGPTARLWEAHVRAQALPYAPKELPTGAVCLTVEFVRERPGYLMAPKYWNRCRKRKCNWKAKATGGPITLPGQWGGMIDDLCEECGNPVIYGLPTPPHTIKPDLGNLEKVLEDALTDVMWNADAQVNVRHSRKRFAALGEQPHVRIAIEYESSGEPKKV